MSHAVTRNPVGLSLPGRLAFLATDSLFYGSASALVKLFSLVTFPLLTRHFSVGEYGLIDFFHVLANLMALAVVFGQDSAMARWFYERNDARFRRAVVSRSLLLQLALAVVGCAVLVWAGRFVPWPGSAVDHRSALVWLVALHVPFLVLSNFSQNLLKWTFAKAKFAFMTFGLVVTTVSVLLAGVLYFHIGLVDALILIVSIRVVFAVIGLALCSSWIGSPAGGPPLRVLVGFGAPYGLIAIMGAFMPAAERTIVGWVVSAEALGLYAVGATVAMLVMLPIQAFQTAWGPFSLSLFKEEDASQTFNHALTSFSVGMGIIVMLLVAAAPLVIPFLAGTRYAGAAVVVFPIAMAMTVQGVAWVTEIGIGLSKRSYLQLYGYTAFVLVGVGAGYLLGLRFGIIGVAVAPLLAHIVRAFVNSWLAQRAHPLDWRYRPAVISLATILAAGTIQYSVLLAYGAIASSVIGLLLVPVVGFLLWACAMDRDNRDLVSSIWRRRGPWRRTRVDLGG